jgi:thioredoxin 1
MVTGVVVSAVVAVALLRSGGDRERPAPAPQRVAVAEAALVGTAGTGGTALALPRMVDLGAGRCLPCRRMAPILVALSAEYAGRAEVVFIDVWERPDLAEGYRFRAIPTQIFYDREGREVWRHEGFLDRPEIVARFRDLGVR